MRKTTRHVYAVIRIDDWPELAVEQRVTVKEIVPTQEIAKAEVARLQKISRGKSRYTWQVTRWVEHEDTQILSDVEWGLRGGK